VQAYVATGELAAARTLLQQGIQSAGRYAPAYRSLEPLLQGRGQDRGGQPPQPSPDP